MNIVLNKRDYNWSPRFVAYSVYFFKYCPYELKPNISNRTAISKKTTPIPAIDFIFNTSCEFFLKQVFWLKRLSNIQVLVFRVNSSLIFNYILRVLYLRLGRGIMRETVFIDERLSTTAENCKWAKRVHPIENFPPQGGRRDHTG